MTDRTTPAAHLFAHVRSRCPALTVAVALVASLVSAASASAQVGTHQRDANDVATSARPIGEALSRLAQSPAPAPVAASSSPVTWRHPVLLGTAIGAGSAALWQVHATRGSTRNIATAALVGAGAGAYTGLVVSTVKAARAGRPVSRRAKFGLVAGAVGAAAGSGLACYAVSSP